MDKTNIDFPERPLEVFLETKEIAIDAMTGEKCLPLVERALKGKEGIRELRVDQERGLISVTYDTRRTDMPTIHDLLLQSGYRPATAVHDDLLSASEEQV